MNTLATGIRVRLKASFLKSTGVPPTDDLWRLTGVIVDSKKVGSNTLASVTWEDDKDNPQSCFAQYLQPVGTPEPL